MNSFLIFSEKLVDSVKRQIQLRNVQSHSRCKGILFCNKNCEISSHKKQKEIEENQKKPSAEEESEETENVNETLPKEMSEAARAEKAKKKKAKKAANKAKSSSDGAFWWNNSVYASW